MEEMECWKRFWRKKSQHHLSSETSLNRCLGVFDLVVIGIGSMVGSGIYILAGITAKQQAGPSILVSFIITMVVVMLIAACFTELAARLHKTGSTYLYLYLTLGELPAFIVGFGILISGVLGGATNARAWSSYLDFLFHGVISNYTETHLAHWNIGPPIASYPDVMAVAVIILLTFVVALGVQCSAKFSAVFVVINVFVLVFVTFCGFIYGHISNWTHQDANDNVTTFNSESNNMTTFNSESNFFPYGWTGTLQGAATCFWAFSGFEMISCAVEECRNPRHDIPVATAITMLLVTSLYLGTAAGLTLLIPYSMIDTSAPLPSAFMYAGLTASHFVVSIGPLCGFTTALISSTYGFVRIGLAMAEDGLLFSWFAHVNSWTRAPVLPVVVCGLFQAIIAFAFDIQDLVVFNVNLLLLSYGSVCVCVIVLRYRTRSDVYVNRTDDSAEQLLSNDQSYDGGSDLSDLHDDNLIWMCRFLKPLFPCKQDECVSVALVVMFLSMLFLSFILVYCIVPLEHGVWWAVVLVTVAAIVVFVSVGVICIHRQVLRHPALQIPCVPLIPCAGVFACIVLLVLSSTYIGWIGFVVMLFLAFSVYFSYAMHHSHLNSISRASRSFLKTESSHEDHTMNCLLNDEEENEI